MWEFFVSLRHHQWFLEVGYHYLLQLQQCLDLKLQMFKFSKVVVIVCLGFEEPLLVHLVC